MFNVVWMMRIALAICFLVTAVQAETAGGQIANQTTASYNQVASSDQLVDVKEDQKQSKFSGNTTMTTMNTKAHIKPNGTKCPPWFYPVQVNGSIVCKCGSDLDGKIKCDENSSQAYLLACNCITYDSDTQRTVVGACVYGCFQHKTSPSYYHKLPPSVTELNNYSCDSFHRTGRLCSKCKDGYVLPSYSYKPECVKCSYTRWNWIKYISVAYVPLTVFFVVVVGCRISATSEQLNAFIFIAQGLTNPSTMRSILSAMRLNSGLPVSASVLVQILSTVYGIWNLDFYRISPLVICLNLSPLQEVSLDYAIACYPFLLISVTYVLINLHERDVRPIVWLWRPFKKCYAKFRKQWDTRTSIVEAFATFLILSYVKFLSVSFDILVPTRVIGVDGHSRHFLFYNAGIEYFGDEHRPYAAMAILVTLFFNILPLLLLLLYPLQSTQRCLSRCRLNSLSLTIFMDAFLGHYKDGTNGTRDCRYFAGMYILMQLICHIIYALAPSGYYNIISAMLFLGVCVIVLVLMPYRSHTYNIVSTFLILSLVVLSISLTALTVGGVTQNSKFVGFSAIIYVAMTIVPALYVTGLVLYWGIVCKRVPQRCLVLVCPRWGHTNWDTNSLGLPDRLRNPQDYGPELLEVCDLESSQEPEREVEYQPDTY